MQSTTSGTDARLSIVHVLAPGDAGGLESVVLALTAGLGARGHKIGIISVVGQGTPEPYLHRLLADRGVPVTPLALPARAYGRERAAYREAFSTLRPDVVHTHGYRPDVLAGPVAERLGIPKVSTVHGFTGGGWKNRLYEYLQLRAFRRFERVIAVSSPLQRRLHSSGLRANQIALIPNAFEKPTNLLSRRDARARLGLPDNEVVIGWVGRLSREKGLDVLLESLQKASGPLLSVLGDGRERVALEAQVNRLGISDKVRWHGLVPEAGRLYRAFDLFVLSSRTEGTPIALFEAMAAEVPVVATAVGGVPDVVRESEALLVPAESPDALGRAIASAMANPDATRTRVAAALQRVHTQFALQPWLDRHEALYRELAGRSSVPAS